jgi:hypothetical protein
VAALLHTLAVEATVHHLDLPRCCPNRQQALRSPRCGMSWIGCAASRAPEGWDDIRYVQVCTGRAELTDDERRQLGAQADRYPLFG